MRKDSAVLVLTVIGSALCWWPVIREPSIDLPLFVPFVIFAALVGAGAALFEGPRLRLAAAASLGCLAGSILGFEILPFTDVIGHGFWLLAVGVLTVATATISTLLTLAMRTVTVPNKAIRRWLWLVLAACVAVGPVALALTPAIVSTRISRNERIAGERVKALKRAVQQSMAEDGDPGSYCRGAALKRFYSGPSFSEGDWFLITTNYVRREGYAYMVFCPEKGGYRISAMPDRWYKDGTREFCADESGKAGCTADGDYPVSRH